MVGILTMKKERFDLYETATNNYDELADFSLDDLE